ncbi:hypothetical protein REDROCK_77 [Mycobacterium phage RedRock]|uniref:Uncharacterized protein n=1 Tax=Mycobacterium phage RedRock TaxID=711470 RepID=D3JZD9_9CAUD|nr:hypothetical protein REDROCK_77 [Mycobacterium phage RedRock]ADB93770.1 hypothetical protein REDROCK_77 [Mycobacterium phage RedRock]
MAQDVKKTTYEVQPIDNPDGTLAGLEIQTWVTWTREADNGRVLDRRLPEKVGDAIEIPIGKVSALIGDMANWMSWYANGDAARDALESRRG